MCDIKPKIKTSATVCTSEALTARASCSLSFFLSRSRWRNRACCSLFSCRITALACLNFSFSACRATASALLFSWTPFRMVFDELVPGRQRSHTILIYEVLNVKSHLTSGCYILTTAFVYHFRSAPGSWGTGQPFVPLLLHPLLYVIQTLLEGLLLGPFLNHGSGFLNSTFFFLIKPRYSAASC